MFYYAGGFNVTGTERMDDDANDTMDDDSNERMWSPGHDTGIFESEVIDVGAIVTGSIYLGLTYRASKNCSYLVEYTISEDDVDYTTYAAFGDGVLEMVG